MQLSTLYIKASSSTWMLLMTVVNLKKRKKKGDHVTN